MRNKKDLRFENLYKLYTYIHLIFDLEIAKKSDNINLIHQSLPIIIYYDNFIIAHDRLLAAD